MPTGTFRTSTSPGGVVPAVCIDICEAAVERLRERYELVTEIEPEDLVAGCCALRHSGAGRRPSLEGVTARLWPDPYTMGFLRFHLRLTRSPGMTANASPAQQPGNAVSTSFTQYDVPIGITASLKL